jgi:flagellar basal body-associated protein FliL
MADKEQDGAAEAGKKKLPMKMLIVVAAVMLVEGAVLGGLWMMFGGSPEAVQAEPIEDDALAEQEEFVEVLLIGDKFQNTRQGAQAYLYDASVYVLVRRKNVAHVEAEIESQMARIRQDVTQIFAKAEPAHLNEPERQTLKRQILASCEERFGKEPGGEPYVEDVVISDWKRFSTDL